MPRINRVRVNNVKYNFGTQFYDDFLMRFSCKNAIYDLANGGGKSVLMLLLLQNLIPNCTLDEKQPIEKLFRTNEGSSTIHSLIEWKLDPVYQKDNFKYMVTGFCARKAKDNDEEKKDTANIEYFNYCIFYREFGDNDIKNLPLSNGKERITYQGLKNYLKDLERKDFGVSVKIFERKNEYQKFLTEYGIFESQWEIVRGINKTEGHVRAYFENNYRTARKVVEDLLIEEIIEKSFANRIGVKDDSDMAKTLLDIKDKLLELTRKKETIDNYDKQIEVLNTFATKLNVFKEIFNKKDMYEDKLIRSYFSVKNTLVSFEALKKEKEEQVLALKKISDELSRDILVGEILEDENELSKLKSELSRSEEELSALYGNKALSESELNLMKVLRYYTEYLSYTKKRDEVKVTIDNRMRDFEEIKSELANLSFTMKKYIDESISSLNKEYDETSRSFKEDSIALSALKEKQAELDKNLFMYSKLVKEYKSDIEALYEELDEYMKKASIIVPDDLDKKISENEACKEKLKLESEEISARLKSLYEKEETLIKKQVGISFTKEKLLEEINEYKKEKDELYKEHEKASKLLEVYNASDFEALEKKLSIMQKNSISEVSGIESEIIRLKNMSESFLQGKYSFDEPQYMEVYNYLSETYGEDVISGDVWLHSLNTSTKRDLLKRVPFITHSIVVKNDFDRIKADPLIRTICKGAYVIPIVGENILYETRNAVSVDNIYFSFKDISFLADDESTLKEIKKLSQEIESKEIDLAKATDKQQIIREDYEYILSYKMGIMSRYDKISSELPDLEEKLISLSDEITKSQEDKLRLDENIRHVSQELNIAKDELSKLMDNDYVFGRIKELALKISKKQEATKDINDKMSKEELELSQHKLTLTELSDNVLRQENILHNLSNKLSNLKEEWDRIYAPYYAENAVYAPLEREEVSARFEGLKAIIQGDAKDISDKEKLYETYDAAGKKALGEIEYLGSDLKGAKEIYDNKKIRYNDDNDLYRVRDSIKDIDKNITRLGEETRNLSAKINRIEGSIEHQVKTITEKYGAFVRPETVNPKTYKESKKEALIKNNENIKKINSEIKADDEKYLSAVVVAKDMERIMKSANILIPENVNLTGEDTFEDYEKIVEAFDNLLKEEAKRKEGFIKDKNELVRTLQELLAFELAMEVKESINPPRTSQDAAEMIDSIEKTNECIKLECDRVVKGIEDMLRIRDNFENRCIQTCMNIRTELDKLPKLSRITMDDEVISIIGLNIPYVKDEYVKERMSTYIQEIILTSESFKDSEERLKYIKGKLTWKKLFSVIVTDMNNIKVNLYKRERIGTQSRYLRYEEAVGSTGQSQGIYIQFLIAIINYISAINATGRETGTIGKTIFIDNPFGAAKDIYIWEPIFKLLKANHVQLIVPTRGTSAAITGRFDVNYVLGQKLVGDKQQTVVVDYRSMADTEQADYSRLEYEQATLDLGNM